MKKKTELYKFLCVSITYRVLYIHYVLQLSFFYNCYIVNVYFYLFIMTKIYIKNTNKPTGICAKLVHDLKRELLFLYTILQRYFKVSEIV